MGATTRLARHFAPGRLWLRREDQDERHGALPLPALFQLLPGKESGTLSKPEAILVFRRP